jgi:hypothetical protein
VFLLSAILPPAYVKLKYYSKTRFSGINGKSDVSADARKIGPAAIFDRLWKQTGIQDAICRLLKNRTLEFDVERAVFPTVFHQLMVSGSDRFCHRWWRAYLIDGVQGLDIHYLYRAMGFLGEELEDQTGATPSFCLS